MKITNPFLVLTICMFISCCNRFDPEFLLVPEEYPTIQAAIDSSFDGDIIIVLEGTYYENINFMGKAITVASEFMVDGDEEHISNTIINGSQAENPDSAAVVMMISGEDTTSVLMGFTITGGNGVKRYGNRVGGGITIYKSGGKIVNNIITENQLLASLKNSYGVGINALVRDNHHLVIRDNTISNNYTKGDWCLGGGIAAYGGGILIENNRIINNTNEARNPSCGVGIFTSADIYDNTAIKSLIIRNNEIIENTGTGDPEAGVGGGIALWNDYNNGQSYSKMYIQIYNNVIAKNYVDGYGGGIGILWKTCALIYNNTIINNEAARKGDSFCSTNDVELTIFNNIMRSDITDDETDLIFLYVTPTNSSTFKIDAYNNILGEEFPEIVSVNAVNNIYSDLTFKQGGYELSEGSPAIGNGVALVEIGDETYTAPGKDIIGNDRPNPIDNLVDIGAYESEYARE